MDEIICISSSDFEKLVDRLLFYIKEKHDIHQYKWITSEEAMNLLNISSKTTLQHLRNNGKIRYTHPTHKILLYDKQSILDYLESNAKETF